MKVLSLCDGMSCGYMALEKAGIKIDKYYASEIKPTAIRFSKKNFPCIVHIGDVKKVSYSNGVLHTENGDFQEEFDIVIFGSPCQSFSRMMKADMRIGLDDDMRSGIFLECYRVLKEVNPKYFLVENVVMKKEDKDILSNYLGVEPVRINSSLVSGQLRDRLYWTNIKFEIPNDKGIKMQDVLDNGYTPRDKSTCLCRRDSNGFYFGGTSNGAYHYHRAHDKSMLSVVYLNKEHYEECVKLGKRLVGNEKPRGKHYHIDSDRTVFKWIRCLNKYERARLQTVPEKYVECMSEKECADLLGDGWTVDVIANIFKGLKR